MDELDARLHRIGQHHFRAKFRLRGRDRPVVDLRGITIVRRHAKELDALVEGYRSARAEDHGSVPDRSGRERGDSEGVAHQCFRSDLSTIRPFR